MRTFQITKSIGRGETKKVLYTHQVSWSFQEVYEKFMEEGNVGSLAALVEVGLKLRANFANAKDAQAAIEDFMAGTLKVSCQDTSSSEEIAALLGEAVAAKDWQTAAALSAKLKRMTSVVGAI